MNKWFSYKFQDEDDHTVMVRGKERLENEIASGKFKQRLEISCFYDSDEADFLPNEEVLSDLDLLEYDLEKELSKGTKSILALSFTGARRRVWYVYTEDVRSAIFSINMAIAPEVELQIIHEPDENWEFYKKFYHSK